VTADFRNVQFYVFSFFHQVV